MANKERDPETGRFLPGRPDNVNITHGASYYLRTGRLPSVRGRRLLARYLRGFERDLRESLGGDLTPQREALMRQILRCENVLRLIELYLLRASPMNPYKLRKGKLELQPCLERSYSNYLSVQRQALLALGLERRSDPEPSLIDIIREHDEEKAREKAGQEEET